MNVPHMRRASRILFRAVVCAACFAGASLAWGATLEDCQSLRKHGHRAEARKCYESLTTARDPYLRAEGFWGTEMYQDANNQFRIAAEQSPANAMIRVRWGRLMHERFNNTEADKLFSEALQRDPKNARAYYGLALVSADGFDSKAIEYTSKAMDLDPKLYEARELMANLLLEDSDEAKAFDEVDAALKISPEALDAMAIHAAIETLADRSPDAWLDKIRQVNPAYGEGYALVAYQLVLNRRYEDGIAYYRKAIEADSRLWSARSQLGINLMRLGQEDEPRRQLELWVYSTVSSFILDRDPVRNIFRPHALGHNNCNPLLVLHGRTRCIPRVQPRLDGYNRSHRIGNRSDTLGQTFSCCPSIVRRIRRTLNFRVSFPCLLRRTVSESLGKIVCFAIRFELLKIVVVHLA